MHRTTTPPDAGTPLPPGDELRLFAALLPIIDARCPLLGLYAEPSRKHPKTDWDNCQGPPTVVVRPDDCRCDGCTRHGRFAMNTA